MKGSPMKDNSPEDMQDVAAEPLDTAQALGYLTMALKVRPNSRAPLGEFGCKAISFMTFDMYVNLTDYMNRAGWIDFSEDEIWFTPKGIERAEDLAKGLQSRNLPAYNQLINALERYAH